MKTLPILILIAMAASGCATSSADKLPVCDGKHRRPANPNGSVLDPSSPPTGTGPAAPAVAPPPSPSPGCGA
jgi:type IV secretion system protein VirB7